jgi:hypothetical protein
MVKAGHHEINSRDGFQIHYHAVGLERLNKIEGAIPVYASPEELVEEALSL